MTIATVIVPSRDRADRLSTLLRHLDRQRLADGELFDVVVALDGDKTTDALYAPSSYALSVIELPRVGISAAKNRAIAQARGDVIILANDDIEPSPSFVHQHLTAQRDGNRIVLGDTPFRPLADSTLFDQSIAKTSMIFAYPSLRSRRRYGFRTAWNLNLSIRSEIIRDLTGPFAESLRPCMYEDLELGHRLMGGDRGVYFHPPARAIHNHRYTFESYLRREAMLGATAPNLWNANRDCFVAIFGQPLNQLVETAKRAVEIDVTDAHRLLHELSELAAQPCRDDESPQTTLFYRAHMPLKRRAFRLGLIAATHQADTDWTALADLADQSLGADDVFSSMTPALSAAPTASILVTATC